MKLQKSSERGVKGIDAAQRYCSGKIFLQMMNFFIPVVFIALTADIAEKSAGC
jgi:hypothetical protein